jgi:DNA-binding MltR family transcriptional regulator
MTMAPRHIPTVETLSGESQALFDVLNGEPDLACVLVGTSFLEEALASMLHQYFFSTKVAKKLLNPANGPLGTFSARIDLAFSLGLIDSSTHNDLHIVRKVRNAFAHSRLSLTFACRDIMSLCRKLKWYERTRLWKEEEARTRLSTDQLRVTIRNRFTISVALISQWLLVQGLGVKKVKAKKDPTDSCQSVRRR